MIFRRSAASCPTPKCPRMGAWVVTRARILIKGQEDSSVWLKIVVSFFEESANQAPVVHNRDFKATSWIGSCAEERIVKQDEVVSLPDSRGEKIALLHLNSGWWKVSQYDSESV